VLFSFEFNTKLRGLKKSKRDFKLTGIHLFFFVYADMTNSLNKNQTSIKEKHAQW